MKILQIIPNLNSGGAERFVVDLSNALSKNNEVYLYTLRGKNEGNIYVDFLAPSVELGYLNQKNNRDIGVIWRLYKLIENINPDVIHTHLRGLHCMMPIKLLNNKCIVVHTIHNSASKDLHYYLEILFFRFFYSTGKVKPVLISNDQKIHFEKLYPKSEFSMIPNGRSFPYKSENFFKVKEEVSGYRVNDNTKIFVNIARLTPQKNHCMLIRSFKRLLEMGGDAILIIIGRATFFDQEHIDIQNFVKEECGTHIKWIGEKNNATDYLYLSDYFCLSSHWEGMPISLIEAFATQSIPVCTPVGQIPIMIEEGKEGFLSNTVSEEDYLNALMKAYKCNNDKLDQIKSNLKSKYNEEYSIESCTHQYVELYNQALTDSGSFLN